MLHTSCNQFLGHIYDTFKGTFANLEVDLCSQFRVYKQNVKSYDNYIYEDVVYKRFSPTSFNQDLFEKVDL